VAGLIAAILDRCFHTKAATSSSAGSEAREILGEFPAGGYMTIVENWR
jgi:hypothetical protein